MITVSPTVNDKPITVELVVHGDRMAQQLTSQEAENLVRDLNRELDKHRKFKPVAFKGGVLDGQIGTVPVGDLEFRAPVPPPWHSTRITRPEGTVAVDIYDTRTGYLVRSI